MADDQRSAVEVISAAVGDAWIDAEVVLEGLTEAGFSIHPRGELVVPPAQVYAALLEDLRDGNCTGSELLLGEANEQTIWLHTREDVAAWLKACLADGVGNEPTA